MQYMLELFKIQTSVFMMIVEQYDDKYQFEKK